MVDDVLVIPEKVPGTLVYFQLEGRASFTRFLLSHAGVAFEDKRIEGPEFAAMKEAGQLPGGQLPVWIENGVTHNESFAILRMLGARHGYYPTGTSAQWAIDSLLDALAPTMGKLYPPIARSDYGEEMMAEFDKALGPLAEIVEKRLAEHNGTKFVAGTDTVSIADMALCYPYFTILFPDQGIA